MLLKKDFGWFKMPFKLLWQYIAFGYLMALIWPWIFVAKNQEKKFLGYAVNIAYWILLIVAGIFTNPIYSEMFVFGFYLMFMISWFEEKILQILANEKFFIRSGGENGNYLIFVKGTNRIVDYKINVKGYFYNDKKYEKMPEYTNVPVRVGKHTINCRLTMYNCNYPSGIFLPVLHADDTEKQREGKMDFKEDDCDVMYVDMRESIFRVWEEKYNFHLFLFPDTISTKKIDQFDYELKVKKDDASGEIIDLEAKEHSHSTEEIDFLTEDNFLVTEVTLGGETSGHELADGTKAAGVDSGKFKVAINYSQQYYNPQMTFETVNYKDAVTNLRTIIIAHIYNWAKDMTTWELIKHKSGDKNDVGLSNIMLDANIPVEHGNRTLMDGVRESTGLSVFDFKLVHVIPANKMTKDIVESMSRLIIASNNVKERIIAATGDVEVKKKFADALDEVAKKINADNTGTMKLLRILDTIEKFEKVQYINISNVQDIIATLKTI